MDLRVINSDVLFALGLFQEREAEEDGDAFGLSRQAAGAPDEIWMVGDNVVADVQGAEAVGIPSILVRSDPGDVERGFEDLQGVRSFLTADRTTLSIRTARADEAETLFQVQRASALAAFSHIFDPERHPFPDETERQRAKDYLDRAEATVLVADVGGQVVGFTVVEGADLVRLWVAPDRWGKGIGARLHDAALDEMRLGGHGRARLWVLEENHRACAFYERRGWALDGQVRTSPFPPHPIAVGYAVELQPR